MSGMAKDQSMEAPDLAAAGSNLVERTEAAETPSLEVLLIARDAVNTGSVGGWA